MGISRTKFTQYTTKSSAGKMQNFIKKRKALAPSKYKPCGLAGDNRNPLKKIQISEVNQCLTVVFEKKFSW